MDEISVFVQHEVVYTQEVSPTASLPRWICIGGAACVDIRPPWVVLNFIVWVFVVCVCDWNHQSMSSLCTFGVSGLELCSAENPLPWACPSGGCKLAKMCLMSVSYAFNVGRLTFGRMRTQCRQIKSFCLSACQSEWWCHADQSVAITTEVKRDKPFDP